MYRVGFPGWKLAARLGVPLLVKIEVMHDRQANVFIATSRDLPGLVVESKSMDTLFPEVYDCVNMLLESQLKGIPRSKPIAAWDGEFCPV